MIECQSIISQVILGEHKPDRIKPGRIKRAALSLQNQNHYIFCCLIRPRLYASDNIINIITGAGTGTRFLVDMLLVIACCCLFVVLLMLMLDMCVCLTVYCVQAVYYCYCML